jgi:hypothetical protein
VQVTREQIKQEIEQLDNAQLTHLAEYIAFLKFRHQLQQRATDLAQFADLYQEFAQEDQRLAETGIANYAHLLAQEDQA